MSDAEKTGPINDKKRIKNYTHSYVFKVNSFCLYEILPIYLISMFPKVKQHLHFVKQIMSLPGNDLFL